MKHYYEARKDKDGLYHGVVYHYSNIDGNEVVDFYSHSRWNRPENAIHVARVWAEDNNIQDLEMP